tara:strand:+ start:96 stop:272 length:177 start_codon:yes stop_codon:yes gene_type:complete
MDTVLTDSLRAELKQLINEVLDERELQVKLNGPYDFPEYDGDLDISINTSGQDVITFS